MSATLCLREVFAWARANGWRPQPSRTLRDGRHVWVDVRPPAGSRIHPIGARRVVVDAPAGGSFAAVNVDVMRRRDGWYQVAHMLIADHTIAVDFLAAAGIVSPLFTTAYRIGYHHGQMTERYAALQPSGGAS